MSLDEFSSGFKRSAKGFYHPGERITVYFKCGWRLCIAGVFDKFHYSSSQEAIEAAWHILNTAKPETAAPIINAEKEEKKHMALEIRTEETGEASGMNVNESLAHAEILTNFQQEIQVASGKAIERAMSYADKLATDLMSRVKQEVAGISRQKQSVLHVSVDEIKRKLTKAASPYLGEAVLQAKLGMNTLLVGPAGCGKTTLAEQVAEALGSRYGHLSLTQGASETWLVGRWAPGGEFIKADFVDFFENGGVFLIDEIDASDANILVLLNTAMANGTLYNPMNGKKVQRHKDFVCIAAANTFGKGGNMVYTGRTRLDGATLNRFACGTIEMDYCPEIEEQLCPDKKLYKKLVKVRKFLRDKQSTEMVTTRELMNAYALKVQGLTEKRIFEKMTASWPKEIAEQSGLFEKESEVVSDAEDLGF